MSARTKFVVDLVVEFLRDGVMDIKIRRVVTNASETIMFAAEGYLRRTVQEIFDTHLKHEATFTNAQMVAILDNHLSEYSMARNMVRNVIYQG